MRIWLEKVDVEYYIHTKEPEWSEADKAWCVEEGKNVGLLVCADVIETVFPHADEMEPSQLAEIELVNCGVWVDDPDLEDRFVLVPGRFVRKYDDEE